MKRDQRRARFSALLVALMERAEAGDTELGNRLGVSRVSVRRWREGQVLPREETVRQLQSALRWVDDTGALRELEDAELSELLIAAGYHTAPAFTRANRIEASDRCIVYSTRYSPDTFPSGWSRRVAELERSIPGAMYSMWNTLPSITREPAFYIGAYESGLYHQDKVQAYMTAHVARQGGFRQRLEGAEVHHLYSQAGVEAFVDRVIRGSQWGWSFWQVPRSAVIGQIERTLSWMSDYKNFEVRVRQADVPGNVTILGHEVVLLSLSLSSSLMTADSVTGLEIVGSAAAIQFTQQFRGFWSDKDTIKDDQHVADWLSEQRRKLIQA